MEKCFICSCCARVYVLVFYFSCYFQSFEENMVQIWVQFAKRLRKLKPSNFYIFADFPFLSLTTEENFYTLQTFKSITARKDEGSSWHVQFYCNFSQSCSYLCGHKCGNPGSKRPWLSAGVLLWFATSSTTDLSPEPKLRPGLMYQSTANAATVQRWFHLSSSI